MGISNIVLPLAAPHNGVWDGSDHLKAGASLNVISEAGDFTLRTEWMLL